MTLSLIRMVMAEPLTGHQDWMKSEVYRRKVDTQDELLDYIMDVFDHIKESQKALRWAKHHVLTQAAKCIDVDIGIFENVLY
jgi:hypothetical protein